MTAVLLKSSLSDEGLIQLLGELLQEMEIRNLPLTQTCQDRILKMRRAERFGLPMVFYGREPDFAYLEESPSEPTVIMRGAPVSKLNLSLDQILETQGIIDDQPHTDFCDDLPEREPLSPEEEQKLLERLDQELDWISQGKVNFDPTTPDGKKYLKLGWKPVHS